jgi:hypothetical protein
LWHFGSIRSERIHTGDEDLLALRYTSALQSRLALLIQ